MADNGFQDGYKEEQVSNSQIVKELRTLTGTLHELAMNLQKTTNSEIFSKKDYLSNVLFKHAATTEKALEKETSKVVKEGITSQKEWISKANKILENFDNYAKKNSQLQEITKLQLQQLISAEKDRLKFQKEMYKISHRQDELVNKALLQKEIERKEKLTDYNYRKATSYSITPEEREINKAKSEVDRKLLPQYMAQSFMEAKGLGGIGEGLGGIARFISQKRGGRTKEQLDTFSEFKKGQAEKNVLKDFGLYSYDVSKEEDVKDLLQETGGYKEYSLLDKIRLSMESKKPSISTEQEDKIADIQNIDLRRRIKTKEAPSKKESNIISFPKKEKNRQSTPFKEDSIEKEYSWEREKSKKSNIIDFPLKEKKQSYSEESMFAFKVFKETYPTQNISPEQVQKVMGGFGIGFLYLGEVFNKLLDPTKNDDPSKADFNEENIESDASSGTNGGMLGKAIKLFSGLGKASKAVGPIKSFLTAAAPAIGTILGTTAIVAGITAVTALIGKSLFDRKEKLELQESNKISASLMEADSFITKRDSGGIVPESFSSLTSEQKAQMEKMGITQETATASLIRSQGNEAFTKLIQILATIDKTRARDSERVEIYRRLKAIDKVRFESEGIETKYPLVTPKGDRIGDEWKYHNGGIIGQKELIAQKGEVILPIAESQEGLSSGILKQTPSGGIEINKQASMGKVEQLLEQLISIISNNLISSVKELKTEPQVNIPSISLDIKSYRGAS
jgi:hypothetical protein